ncbi:amino acid ABC transporter permease [Buchananella felis]|uniref:amino acid ABC transporter permease n=1 Tax=Buchananella felis TaxID=3231492 RepID=UPI0035273D2C
MSRRQVRDGVELIDAVPVPRPSRWVSAAIVAVLAAMVVNSLFTNPQFRWDVVWKYLFSPQVVSGVQWTLILTVAAMVIGIVLAITAAIMRESTNPVLRSVSWVYIWFFRGTPIYTQLIFWGLLGALYPKLSLGIPFGPEFFTFKTTEVITAVWAAILGLGLNEGAYLAEIVRAGLNSVDKGQAEAARALGMSRGLILRRVILPQAMRVIVPPTGNETISMLKTTSLVVAVPFTLELQYAARTIGNRTFMPIPALIVAALWYLAITSILMVGQHYLERHFGKGFEGRDLTKVKGKPGTQAAIAASQTTHASPFLDVTP